MQGPRSTSGSCETRRRLIEAAGDVFAEHGFANATIRQICDRADANVAAVNYHFRDKAELYEAVLRYSHCAAEAAYAGCKPLAHAAAEQRLAAYVHCMMSRILDEGRPAWHGKLMSREMTEPTTGLDALVRDVFQSRFQELWGIVTELLGPLATKDDVEKCSNSIIAQGVFYQHCKPLLLRMDASLRYDKPGIDQLVKHVMRFSLLGLQGFRQSLETRGASNGVAGSATVGVAKHSDAATVPSVVSIP
jgi:TetR/AcrR family transcriptional regulator, regulator of cefoperazone and chloramphenicol sensitivity